MKHLLAAALLAGSCLASVHAQVPNIEGPWQIISPGGALKPVDGSPLPFTPAGQAQYKANQANLTSLDPMRRCLPPGVPRLMMQPYPFNIIQGRTMYGFMFEWNHLNRVAYLWPKHTETIGPLYLGESIGHWDGKSFVVDTNSYDKKDWLDDTGVPTSYDLHTIERFTLKKGGSELQDQITIDDPTIFTKPWIADLLFRKEPGRIIKEDYCLGRMGLGKIPVKNSDQ